MPVGCMGGLVGGWSISNWPKRADGRAAALRWLLVTGQTDATTSPSYNLIDYPPSIPPIFQASRQSPAAAAAATATAAAAAATAAAAAAAAAAIAAVAAGIAAAADCRMPI